MNPKLHHFCVSLAARKCALVVWWARCIFTDCCTIMDTEQICFAIYIVYIFHILQIWQKFSFHSCLQLPGDGANWTKTVFHCGLTGSCESIYSLTAMRQNGPWKIDTSKRPEKTRKGSLGVGASDNVHIWRNPCMYLLHLIMQNNVLPQAQAHFFF